MNSKNVYGNSGKKSGVLKKKHVVRGTVHSSQAPFSPVVKREGASFFLFISAIIGILTALLMWKGGAWVINRIQRENRYNRIIVQSAIRNGIDPCLLKAVIWKESRFDTECIGTKGEIGLMQLMPQSAVKDWETAYGRKLPSKGVLTDPALNIEIGSWYLAQCLMRWKEYKDRIPLALCEYNAGIQRALKWRPLLPDESMLGAIDIPSTAQYVKEISEKQKEYYEKWDWRKYK